MSRLRRQDGFTVIELAVAASISLVILGLSMTVMISMWTQAKRTERHNDAMQQVRQATDRLARQLRNLASPSDTITAATSAQPKSVDRNLPYDLVFKDVDEGALTFRKAFHGQASSLRCLDAPRKSTTQMSAHVRSSRPRSSSSARRIQPTTLQG